MRPPICAICNRDFRTNTNQGGLVQFNLSTTEVELNEQLKKSQISGHPQGLEWFCKDHIVSAKKYRNLTYAEACEKIVSD